MFCGFDLSKKINATIQRWGSLRESWRYWTSAPVSRTSRPRNPLHRQARASVKWCPWGLLILSFTKLSLPAKPSLWWHQVPVVGWPGALPQGLCLKGRLEASFFVCKSHPIFFSSIISGVLGSYDDYWAKSFLKWLDYRHHLGHLLKEQIPRHAPQASWIRSFWCSFSTSSQLILVTAQAWTTWIRPWDPHIREKATAQFLGFSYMQRH